MFKKIISIIMVVTMALSTFLSFAFAEDVQNSLQTASSPLKISTSILKQKYSTAKTVNYDVTVTNNSDEIVENVTLWVECDSWALKDGSNILNIDSLKPGEKKTLSMNCVRNKNENNIDFFSKIILFIAQLFTETNDFESVKANRYYRAYVSETTKHGNKAITIEAKCQWGRLSENNNDYHQFETLESEVYTLEMIVTQIAEGKTTKVPIKVARNGSKFYSYVEFPMEKKDTITLEFISDGSNQYIVLPKLKTYLFSDEDLQGIFIPTEIMNTEKSGTYLGSSTAKIDGINYITEEYEQDDVTITYFSINGVVKRVEYVSESESMIVEYTKISNSADDLLFQIPGNYIPLDKYLNTEVDISDLLD